mgnify:CR=1 FL=1
MPHVEVVDKERVKRPSQEKSRTSSESGPDASEPREAGSTGQGEKHDLDTQERMHLNTSARVFSA